MADPAKRKFWQFHLSTLIVATALVGTFLGLNLKTRTVRYEQAKIYVRIQGWPFDWYEFLRWHPRDGEDDQEELPPLDQIRKFKRDGSLAQSLLRNVLICSALTALGALAIEFANRRRAHKL